VAAEREYLYQSFDALDLNYVKSQANFVLLPKLPMNAKALADAVLRQGVIIRWAGSMGLPDAVRVTVGTHAQNEQFVGVLRAVLEAARVTI